MGNIRFGISYLAFREGVVPRPNTIDYPLERTDGFAALDLPSREGDVIFGVSDGYVREVSLVVESAPPFRGSKSGAAYVGTNTLQLANPLPIADVFAARPPRGCGVEKCVAGCVFKPDFQPRHVVALAAEDGQAILTAVASQALPVFANLREGCNINDVLDQQAMDAVLARSDLSEEVKAEMMDAFYRRGAFRQAVEARNMRPMFAEPEHEGVGQGWAICFIKPWRMCSDAEKVDPDNAILIDPELVPVFEWGGLTMDVDGYPVVSSALSDRYFEGTSFRLTDEIDWFVPSPAQKRYFAFRNRHLFVNHSLMTLAEAA